MKSHPADTFCLQELIIKPFSYNGFEETELKWRLDYIFTSPEVKVISSKIERTNFSDHLPVRAELEI